MLNEHLKHHTQWVLAGMLSHLFVCNICTVSLCMSSVVSWSFVAVVVSYLIYHSYCSMTSVILWQLQNHKWDTLTATKRLSVILRQLWKNQVWYLKSHRIAKIQSSESLNCRYDISHAIHAECDNTHVTKNRFGIIPAETHWDWDFLCSFSLSEILYKLEYAKCDILSVEYF